MMSRRKSTKYYWQLFLRRKLWVSFASTITYEEYDQLKKKLDAENAVYRVLIIREEFDEERLEVYREIFGDVNRIRFSYTFFALRRKRKKYMKLLGLLDQKEFGAFYTS